MVFDSIAFKGTFRPYQQSVLDNSKQFLENKKIHIVASPGSGKTILGLELITRLDSPALILSPTITIKQQWQQRFAEMFLGDDMDIGQYFSLDLNAPSIITSITYQGLYSTYCRAQDTDSATSSTDGDDEIDVVQENFTNIEILKLLKERNIKTICLDEAHHLKKNWQNTLSQFVSSLDNDVTIIALTATPPYDSTPAEWQKYIDICGEIDDEIFVPQLVRTKSLCPHQDYICYNYPSAEELSKLDDYHVRSQRAIDQIVQSGLVLDIIKRAPYYADPDSYKDALLDSSSVLIAIIALLKSTKCTTNRALLGLLPKREHPHAFSFRLAEVLFQSIINDRRLYCEEDGKAVLDFFKERSLVERRQVRLVVNSRLEKMVTSSLGKLESIKKIALYEDDNMGKKLKLLILTDYIKEKSNVLGTDNAITDIGVVPIFELLRRQQSNLKIATLSGRLVIIPNSSIDNITALARQHNIKISISAIHNTHHSRVNFASNVSSQKVFLITQAFSRGFVNCIVGTKSLLGEGWDSPAVNTLILASFVGSFVSSNQMRGRAIRIDNSQEGKFSNIWHLATIIPQYLDYETKLDKLTKKYSPFRQVDSRPNSSDYTTLERRFESFVGIDNDGAAIVSGIDRVSQLEYPFDKNSVTRANNKTFALAHNRSDNGNKWDTILDNCTDEIVIDNTAPPKILPTRATFTDMFAFVVGNAIFGAIFVQIIISMLSALSVSNVLLCVLSAIVLIIFNERIVRRLVVFLSPSKGIKVICQAILQSYQQLGHISNSAKLHVDKDKNNMCYDIHISNCTNHEKNIFFDAVNTVVNPIENPRYLFVKKRVFYDYSSSFALPKLLAKNEESAKLFEAKLKKIAPGFVVVYTRNIEGRKIMWHSRKLSYISRNYITMHGKKKLKEKWK